MRARTRIYVRRSDKCRAFLRSLSTSLGYTPNTTGRFPELATNPLVLLGWAERLCACAVLIILDDIDDVYGELTELHEVRLSERGLYQWVLYP